MTDKPLDILFLSPRYWPATGGAESHVQFVAEGLVREGHRATVVTGWDSRRPQPEEALGGVRVVRTPDPRWDTTRGDFVAWEECLYHPVAILDAIGAATRYDVVHSHCQVSVPYGAMIAEDLGAPHVATLHETEPEAEPLGSARLRLTYSHLPVDMFAPNSVYFDREAELFGVPVTKRTLITSGVDTEHFRRVAPISRSRWGVPDGAAIVMQVGRIKKRKGQLEFLRAFAATLSRGVDAHAVIVGRPEAGSGYLEQLKAYTRQAGIEDRVHVDSTVSYADLPAVLSAADVYVQASLKEGLGIALIEAMACEAYVLAAEVCGITQVLEGLGDHLYDPDDPDQLPARLAAVLDPISDRRRRGAELRTRVEQRFDLHRAIDTHVALYRTLTARSG